jgi:hypothetical protein
VRSEIQFRFCKSQKCDAASQMVFSLQFCRILAILRLTDLHASHYRHKRTKKSLPLRTSITLVFAQQTKQVAQIAGNCRAYLHPDVFAQSHEN